MDNQIHLAGDHARLERLLATLEGLLAIQATESKGALDRASQLVAEVFNADKVDVFLYEPEIDTLVAMGTSDTPMGHKQQAMGLDRLAVSNGGKTVDVFQTGEPYLTGHLDREPDELRGIKEGLGVRSAMVAPLDVEGARRGVVQVDSARPDEFTEADMRFLQAVAQWIAMVLHRAELVERVAQEAVEQTRRSTAAELITIIAHDLRVPLVPVRGYLGMIRMQAERENQQAYLRFVAGAERGIQRLQAMLTDLLDTSRLEQGVFALNVELFNLAALTHETANTLRTPTTPIEVLGPDEILIEADPHRIRQALENLIGNAIRHSPEGILVIVELAVEKGEKADAAVIAVRDAGPGIAPELLPKLFTRFGAGGSSKGLGLGLYLVRGIAEAHGGKITVDSAPGKGATFRLSLPIPKAHA